MHVPYKNIMLGVLFGMAGLTLVSCGQKAEEAAAPAAETAAVAAQP